jgi:hypothetical protein
MAASWAGRTPARCWTISPATPSLRPLWVRGRRTRSRRWSTSSRRAGRESPAWSQAGAGAARSTARIGSRMRARRRHDGAGQAPSSWPPTARTDAGSGMQAGSNRRRLQPMASTPGSDTAIRAGGLIDAKTSWTRCGHLGDDGPRAVRPRHRRCWDRPPRPSASGLGPRCRDPARRRRRRPTALVHGGRFAAIGRSTVAGLQDGSRRSARESCW